MFKVLFPVLLLFGLMAHSQPGNPLLHKLSFSLRGQLFQRANDSLEVSICFRKSQEQNNVQKRFFSKNDYEIAVRKISAKDLDSLVSRNDVVFINEIHSPKEELTTGAADPTLNRINYARKNFPAINGDSLNVIVKEKLPDTTDVDLKGRFFKTGFEASSSTSHASLMSTIIAGGGNSSHFAKGCAVKANVGSSDFINLFPDADSLFSNKKVFAQNHSYGTTVENFYGNEAAAYDLQENSVGGLVHVFSAGNSGNVTPANGIYANVQQVANLTGNFKQAKNIITVGSLDSAAQLVPLSSKGPAFDGRVKPELMAYGEDGSSGAAATVSGAVVLLQQAFKKKYGQLPSLQVIKSILVNSAGDVGIANVDYSSGYGSLDVFKAIETINGNRIIEGFVIQGETKSFNLTVPAGVSKLKISLVWNDPAALPGATKALVNDLDLQLNHPSSSTSWLPWVLDPTPNLTAIQSAAQRKVDTLNVVEQITLDNPVAGNYRVDVKGSKVATTNQTFAVAWQADTANSFYWTYPTSDDPLTSKNTHWLRWESNISGQGQIEYATNGNNWRPVGTVQDLSSKYFKWIVPDTITTAVLRMRIQSSGASIVSDSFVISPRLSMETGFNCPDSFLLYWNSIAASQYRVYELGAKYMQPFAQQSDTAIILNKSQHIPVHYAVAPLVNGKEGTRSFSVNYTSQGVGCYIKNFYLQSQSTTTAFFHAEIGSLYNVQSVSFQKRTTSGFISLASIITPTTLQFLFSDSALTQGENWYRFKVELKNGLTFYSDPGVAYYLPASPVIVYPNPVQQYQPLTILISESGRFGLQIFDDKGRLYYNKDLNSTTTVINSGRFGKGIYLFRISDKAGKVFVQKIWVQ